MRRLCSIVVFIGLILSFSVGCQSTPEEDDTPFHMPSITSKKKVSFQYRIPEPTLSKESKAIQKRKGVKLAVLPVPFSKSTSYQKIKKISRGFKKGNSKQVNRFEYIDYIYSPKPILSPDQLTFKITVYNQSNHVLRLAGSVVEFQVEGKTFQIRKSNYETFQNGIIPPLQSREYTIGGPLLITLPQKDSIIIGFFIYDVTTKTDAAGNPIQKENFQWYYTYKFETEIVNSMQTKVKRVMVDLKPMACLLCDGSGEEKCSSCGGSGRELLILPCGVCNGSGKEPCPLCYGSGKIRKEDYVKIQAAQQAMENAEPQ